MYQSINVRYEVMGTVMGRNTSEGETVGRGGRAKRCRERRGQEPRERGARDTVGGGRQRRTHADGDELAGEHGEEDCDMIGQPIGDVLSRDGVAHQLEDGQNEVGHQHVEDRKLGLRPAACARRGRRCQKRRQRWRQRWCGARLPRRKAQ
eukprot:3487103-Prymnesium_polylepis.1